MKRFAMWLLPVTASLLLFSHGTALAVEGACCDPTADTCLVMNQEDCLWIYLGDDTDCEPNCCPIPIGSQGDCNNTGFPDICDIESGLSQDCNTNGVPDECDTKVPAVDIVFIVDTSGSMNDEAEALCCGLPGALMALNGLGFDLHAKILGIRVDPCPPPDSPPPTVARQYGTHVPPIPADPPVAAPPCCRTLGTGEQGEEDWGPATAIVASGHAWRPGALRIVVPVSDEAPRLGCGCDLSDEQSVDHAIGVCNALQVIASPIFGTNSGSCWGGDYQCALDLAQHLADQTGGVLTVTTNPQADIVGALVSIVLAATGDCNTNRVPDTCEIASGASQDCNGTGIPDECETDCQPNGVADECEIAANPAIDGNQDGIPDECQDCNQNGQRDDIDIGSGTSHDYNNNGIPDECDPDCDGDTIPDFQEIASGTSVDCEGACENGIPDDCEEDCQPNGIADTCEVATGQAEDCHFNGVPDECEIRISDGGLCDEEPCSSDCNNNDVPDECDIADATSEDCQPDGAPDECQIRVADGGLCDEEPCSADCQRNGVPDECDLIQGTSLDCNGNNIPDECDIADGPSVDCNGNGIPDECDLASGASEDCNGNGVPDECDPDCNGNGIADDCEIADGLSPDCNSNGIPDECDLMEGGGSLDCNGNGIPDECQVAIKTGHDLFVTDLAFHDFADTPLPRGFFGEGSDEFRRRVNFTGLPIRILGDFDVGATDTIVRRLEPAYFDQMPDAYTIGIELIALSLVTTESIEVTFNEGDYSRFFRVFITQSPGKQSFGTMTIHRRDCVGGDYDAFLEVYPLFTFTEVGAHPPVVLTLDGADIGYVARVDTSEFPSWERVPTHGQWIVPGFSGDETNLTGQPWLFDFYVYGDAKHTGPHSRIHGCLPADLPALGFPEGMPVLLPDGRSEKIDSLKAGDKVAAFDTAARKTITGVVKKVWKFGPESMGKNYLIINDTVRVIPEYLLLHQDGKWERAQDAKVGDVLFNVKDKNGTVIKTLKAVDRPVPTYDLWVVADGYPSDLPFCVADHPVSRDAPDAGKPK